jgi:hypothetical protein
MKKAFSGGEGVLGAVAGNGIVEFLWKRCTTVTVRVDYQRISQEAYEGRDEMVPGRLDRTTLAGAVVICCLMLLPFLLALILAGDLLHQSVAQTIEGMLHAIELRVAGL